MADLIVPPNLRQRHRAGLARFLDGAPAVILDRRLELTAMRKDGTEFPVELTITKIALPGPPTFTGYLRDITDRVKAEQALLASRAAWSRWPTKSVSGSSGTSTTARSSG
jgi:PAS domain S-box-containing protein